MKFISGCYNNDITENTADTRRKLIMTYYADIDYVMKISIT